MARRRKKKQSALDYIRLPRFFDLDLDPDTKKGIFILIIWWQGDMISLFKDGGWVNLIFIFRNKNC